LSPEGRFSTSFGAVLDDVSDILNGSLSEMPCREILKQDMEECMGNIGKDVKEAFSLWKKHTEDIFNLCFSSGEFLFEFLQESGDGSKFRHGLRGFKQLRVKQSK